MANKNKNKKPKNTGTNSKLKVTNIKIMAIPLLFILLGFFVIVLRLVKIQIIDPDNYAELAATQHMSVDPISPKRGSIYDVNNKVLAETAHVWKVIASPSSIDPERKNDIANVLASILDMDTMEVSQKLFDKEHSNYEVIKRRVEEPEKQAIKEYLNGEGKYADKNSEKKKKISGIYFEEDYKRYYPQGTMASSVIGFTGNDHQGLEGLEKKYDDTLSGVRGRDVRVTNVKGAATPFEYKVNEYPAQDGYSLVLTIDEEVQNSVEKRLNEAIEKNAVKNRAVGIVMDVNTGAVIAMASEQGYDPANPSDIANKDALAKIKKLPDEEQADAIAKERLKQWRNKAVVDTYEPGSVFKIITGAAALESATSSHNDTFFCDGKKLKIGGEDIGCWNVKGHGNQTFTEAMMHSCNPAFIKMADNMGPHEFFKYFKAFGFTERTGIDLPGEQLGRFYQENELGVTQLATNSFGQTFTTTPIQMITAVCASVNGGYVVKPHIVKNVIDSSGNVVESFGREVKRQVVSEDVSKDMSSILEAVVNKPGGSGKNAYVEGFRIGGKTGTSEKTETRKDLNKPADTISSFVGIAPAENPKYAVLILLDEPFDANRHASTLAAPVVGDIFRDILEYLGIEPQYTDEEKEKIPIAVPSLLGKDDALAKGEIESMGFKVQVEGEPGTIVRQTPTHGQKMVKGGTIVIYTGNASEDDKMAVVPDVTKLSPTEAKRVLQEAGLNVYLSGGAAYEVGAKVFEQSHIPTTKVPIGTIITVECFKDEQIR